MMKPDPFSNLWIIAGLGNPGEKYSATRHNVGFMVIDGISGEKRIPIAVRDGYSMGKGTIGDIGVVLLKPLTYMNLSGRAVKDLSDRFEIPKENILVVYDDVNLDYGTLRMRPSGSDGGQNGIKSVIYEFESEDIPRLRLGIRYNDELEKVKDDDGSYSLADYVLSDFSENEMKNIDKVITAAKDSVLSYISIGLQETMNIFNRNYLSS